MLETLSRRLRTTEVILDVATYRYIQEGIDGSKSFWENEIFMKIGNYFWKIE